ncbi:MAG: Ig-like domain-containing protein, partial [Lachnospiraceae bacterium]|nr:Ig-like domain-containing protein [Lachnospiraceae bacterium]
KGRSVNILAEAILVDDTKKLLSEKHAAKFRYLSSDKSVAKVSSDGKITAVGKGTCYIYVYAKNGYAKKIIVTVK